MNKKIRWGIISTAKIARTQMIPAIQASQYGEVAGIASNDRTKAQHTAAELNIPTVYDTYEALLASADIDAVYNPLPNHLHLPYTLKALAAGKHVLCEKPIGINAAEAQQLADAASQYPHLKVMEAFMYRFHLQWQKVQQLIAEDVIGEAKHVHTHFSYTNMDAGNIRNRPDAHGGALMDIGCYCISFPRFVYGQEPQRVMGLMQRDPNFGTDSLTSGMLDMGNGHTAAFTCSTQLEPYQRCHIFGSKGRLEIEVPVNAPNDAPCRLYLQRDRLMEELTIPAANQYTLQADAFAQAILNDTTVPTSLTDAIANMRVIDAVVKSAADGVWVDL